jgi:hypothetical protein
VLSQISKGSDSGSGSGTFAPEGWERTLQRTRPLSDIVLRSIICTSISGSEHLFQSTGDDSMDMLALNCLESAEIDFQPGTNMQTATMLSFCIHRGVKEGFCPSRGVNERLIASMASPNDKSQPTIGLTSRRNMVLDIDKHRFHPQIEGFPTDELINGTGSTIRALQRRVSRLPTANVAFLPQ